MIRIESRQNPRLKDAVRLRQRSHRNKTGLMLIEGYRELKRALDNKVSIQALFYCPEVYIGENEPELVARCEAAGAELLECTPEVFEKLSYRDRPEGLCAVAPQVGQTLDELDLPEHPLLIIAEAVEKPGNLGTIMRSADAAGVDAVIVCDACTDLGNPNVVRASIGTLFTVPIAEASTEETLAWVRDKGISVLAATPAAEKLHTETDMTGSVAIVVGTEQIGLSDRWLSESSLNVRLPMYGQVDSLNVAAATTILLYEAIRQRHLQG